MSQTAPALSDQDNRATAGEIFLALILLVLLVLGGLVLSSGTQALWIVLVSATFPITSVLLQSGIERLFPPAGPRKPFKRWLLHLQVNTFFDFLRATLTIATFLTVAAVARNLGFELGLFDLRFASATDLLLLVASLWLASVIGDFFFYWYHRWTHVNQFLWQHHKMHHTDTELEAISTARQNWMESVFNSLFITVPILILFKVDPLEQWHAGIAAGITAAVLNNLLTLSHMNVRWHVGWFSRVWCAPQVHRIHHSLEPQHINKNFAFMFPMWDVIFGTYYHPGKDDFPATGVAGEPGFDSFWEAEIYSQREMWKYWKNRKARKAAAGS
ncbi:MAG: sterol desaturase family protein [Novosphingobium sp.]|nr:sterol desaturase family protein [Novosphingobium sp.]